MDVACLGILVADIFASPIDSLPREGELKATDRFWMSVGGCAANTAVDLRRLNRSVAVIGKVGTDKSGDFVNDDLGRHSIKTPHANRRPGLPPSSPRIVIVQRRAVVDINCME